MKSRLIKLVISGLLIVLSLTTLFTYNSFKTSQRNLKIQQNLNNQVKQEQTFRVISKETITTKLNKENSINCLSGEKEAEVTYSNMGISNEDINIQWLRSKLKGRTATVSGNYKFNFAFDVNNLPVKIYNNTVIIQLSPNRLTLTQCELLDVKTTENMGWFTSNLNNSETNNLNKRTQQYAKNAIQSDGDLRSEAMENIQDNIKNLLQIDNTIDKTTNVRFEISDYDVVQNTDANIINTYID